MKRLYPGLRGKLTDLCRPRQKKYNRAVAVALGSHMDSLVVDTEQCGFDCIRYLREQRIGRARIIPLDTIQVKVKPCWTCRCMLPLLFDVYGQVSFCCALWLHTSAECFSDVLLCRTSPCSL